jgi:hypothetical protein
VTCSSQDERRDRLWIGVISLVIRTGELRGAATGASLQHQLPPFRRRQPGQNLAGWTMIEVFDAAAARHALARRKLRCPDCGQGAAEENVRAVSVLGKYRRFWCPRGGSNTRRGRSRRIGEIRLPMCLSPAWAGLVPAARSGVRVHDSWEAMQPTQRQHRSGVLGEQHLDNTNETALFSLSDAAANMASDKPNTLVKWTDCGYRPCCYRAGQTF